jgi:hypothetical protein
MATGKIGSGVGVDIGSGTGVSEVWLNGSWTVGTTVVISTLRSGER